MGPALKTDIVGNAGRPGICAMILTVQVSRYNGIPIPGSQQQRDMWFLEVNGPLRAGDASGDVSTFRYHKLIEFLFCLSHRKRITESTVEPIDRWIEN